MTRSVEQERLDMEVAIRLFRFHWVQWNKQALGGGPLYTPGVFLAAPDDYFSHLYEEAPPQAAWHHHALAKVPEYSRDETCAFRAAEQSALFRAGGGILSQEEDGTWVVHVAGRQYASPRLPELICRASLAWAGNASVTRG
jgi:hypothetical protein